MGNSSRLGSLEAPKHFIVEVFPGNTLDPQEIMMVNSTIHQANAYANSGYKIRIENDGTIRLLTKNPLDWIFGVTSANEAEMQAYAKRSLKPVKETLNSILKNPQLFDPSLVKAYTTAITELSSNDENPTIRGEFINLKAIAQVVENVLGINAERKRSRSSDLTRSQEEPPKEEPSLMYRAASLAMNAVNKIPGVALVASCCSKLFASYWGTATIPAPLEKQEVIATLEETKAQDPLPALPVKAGVDTARTKKELEEEKAQALLDAVPIKEGFDKTRIKEHIKFQMNYIKGIANGEVQFSLNPFKSLKRSLVTEGKMVDKNGVEVGQAVHILDSLEYMLKTGILKELYTTYEAHATEKMHAATLFLNALKMGLIQEKGFYDRTGEILEKACLLDKPEEAHSDGLASRLPTFCASLGLKQSLIEGFIQTKNWKELLIHLIKTANPA